MAGSPLDALEKQAAANVDAVLSQLAQDEAELAAELAQRRWNGVEGLSAARKVSEALRRLNQRLKPS